MVRILLIFVVVLISLVPVKLAAMVVNAKRTSFAWCLLATIVAGLLQLVGLGLRGPGNLAALFLGAAGYSAILKTRYVGGLAIMVLQVVIALAMFLGLCGVLGVMAGLPRLGPVYL